MADNELKQYPRGSLAIGNGDVQSAASASFTTTNNGKLVHTLRRSPAGVVLGTREASGTFELVVDEDGLEIEIFNRIANGDTVNFRFKMPQTTKVIEGILTNADISLPVDDVVGVTLAFVGRLKAGS